MLRYTQGYHKDQVCELINRIEMPTWNFAMATVAEADIIEPAEPNNSSDNDVSPPAQRHDCLHHPHHSRTAARNLDQILRGENRNIPPSPVGSKVLYLAAVCAFSGLISGELSHCPLGDMAEILKV